MTPSGWPKKSPCWTSFGGRIISALCAGPLWRPSRRALTPRRTGAIRGDLIIKCWTTRAPSGMRGSTTSPRRSTPGVPCKSPTRTSGSPGPAAPRAWSGRPPHGHPYMNLGALVDTTEWLRQVYIDTAKDVGFQPGPQHFGYLLRCLVADTDEEAIELRAGVHVDHWPPPAGPREHNDPPGYQSREAVRVKAQRPEQRRGGWRFGGRDDLRAAPERQ